MSFENELKDYLMQDFNLSHLLCEALCRQDYIMLQLVSLDLICMYKAMHLSMLAGKTKELTKLSTLFTKKLDDLIKKWLPEAIACCQENNITKNKRMN